MNASDNLRLLAGLTQRPSARENTAMDTILVTGATGRLGANLIRQLLDRGYAVRALVIPDDPKRRKLDGWDVEVVVGDLRDSDLAPKLVADVDGVVHTANILGPPAGMDARDVAHACICALEHPAAVGETFNAAVPRPFTFDEVARFLAARTGRSVLEVDLPVRWVYWSDIRKARSLIGYQPQGDLERVFDTALAHEAGEATDVVPA
jgi:nucleoside-diphosphate-sugar epimerase